MKKVISIILVALMMFSVMAVSASAAGSSMSNATSVSFGTTYSDSLTNTNTKDFYKFTISSSGTVNLVVTSYIQTTKYYIYDCSGNTVWSKSLEWDYTTNRVDMNEDICLTSGTYYFCVAEGYLSGIGNYNFKVKFSSSNESFKETGNGTDNSLSKANLISTEKTYYGQLANNDTKDFYKFTLSSSGAINVKLRAYIQTIKLYVYNSNGETIWSKGYEWNYTTEQLDVNVEMKDLKSDTYYFCVEKGYLSGIGDYNFSIATSSNSTSTTTYKLSYNANGGSGAPSSQTGKTTYTISSIEPTRSGYEFLGWSKSSSAISASYDAGDKITLTSNTTLYAVWDEIESDNNNDGNDSGSSDDSSGGFSNIFEVLLFIPMILVEWIVSLFAMLF